MKLSQLQKKYPKASYKFVEYFRKTQPKSMCQEVYEMMDRVKDYDVRGWWKEICDFMDKQGIYIEIKFDEFNRVFGYSVHTWNKDITSDNYQCFSNSWISSRKQAETKAIEKTFQILEERSKE